MVEFNRSGKVSKKINRLPSLMETIRASRIIPRKRLSQNFLLDITTAQKIVRCSGFIEGMTIFEIGPGVGSLTRALLLEGASRVIAVEKDRNFIKPLKLLQKDFGDRIIILHGDALTTQFKSLSSPPRKIVSNLPYNIATPLLIRLLKIINEFSGFTFLFQREVARRITANPGSPFYGKLSILSQYMSFPKKVLDLSPHSFFPIPKVWSSVVNFTPRNYDQPVNVKILELITRITFSQRRKILSSSLKNFLKRTPNLLQRACIDKNCRPDNLSVISFLKLTRIIEKENYQEISKQLSN